MGWGEGLVPVCEIVFSWGCNPTSWKPMVSQAKPLNSAQPQAMKKPGQAPCCQRSILSILAKQLGQVMILLLLSRAQVGD